MEDIVISHGNGFDFEWPFWYEKTVSKKSGTWRKVWSCSEQSEIIQANRGRRELRWVFVRQCRHIFWNIRGICTLNTSEREEQSIGIFMLTYLITLKKHLQFHGIGMNGFLIRLGFCPERLLLVLKPEEISQRREIWHKRIPILTTSTHILVFPGAIENMEKLGWMKKEIMFRNKMIFCKNVGDILTRPRIIRN